MPRRTSTIVSIATLVLFAACGQPEPPPEPAFGERVECPGLKIAIAAVPSAFTVTTNEGTDLVLTAPGPNGDGRASFAMGEIESGGINLVEAVKAKKAEFEAGGTYYGNRELGSPIGTAFTARGAWPQDDGSEVEEIWVFAIHPVENRLLTMTFSYPSGESQERVNQLLDLFGEVEGL